MYITVTLLFVDKLFTLLGFRVRGGGGVVAADFSTSNVSAFKYCYSHLQETDIVEAKRLSRFIFRSDQLPTEFMRRSFIPRTTPMVTKNKVDKLGFRQTYLYSLESAPSSHWSLV